MPHVQMHPVSAYTEFKDAMRTQLLRLALHFLAGMALAAFLLPEGAGIVLASAVAVAGAKTFYDYLNRNINMPACLCLLLGAMAVVMATNPLP